MVIRFCPQKQSNHLGLTIARIASLNFSIAQSFIGQRKVIGKKQEENVS